MEKENDKRVSRVSGCRETRDPAREQEPNNYKPSEGLTVIGVRHCSTSFACIYLFTTTLYNCCYGTFQSEVKHLTQSRTASEWESKDFNLGSLVLRFAALLCCLIYFLLLPTLVLFFEVWLLPSLLHWNCSHKSWIPNQQILYFYRGIQSTVPYFTLLKHSPHPDLKSLHHVYVSLLVLTSIITVFTAIIPIWFFIISSLQQTQFHVSGPGIQQWAKQISLPL